jgi:hypothetical protein
MMKDSYTPYELALYRQRMAYYFTIGFIPGKAAILARADVIEDREPEEVDNYREHVELDEQFERDYPTVKACINGTWEEV